MKKAVSVFCLILLVTAVLVVSVSAADMFVEKELTPIVSVEAPKGGGSKDIYVINDGVFEGTDKEQYDTYNARSEPGEDFIGYTFPKTYTIKAFEFTEGNSFWDGGWFEMGTQRIEVLQNGEWVKLENVSCDPEYPVGLLQEDFGEGWETFTFTFDPVECDGVRIAGMAGGQASFISCAEARVLAVVPDDYVVSDPHGEALAAEAAAKEIEEAAKTEADLAEGYISRLFTPSTNIDQPKGGGNHDINVINDLDWIDEGAEGVDKRQYDTYIAATEPHEVWYAYDFGGKTYNVTDVIYYEGMHFWDGGYFSDGLRVEALKNGEWVAVDADSGYPVSANSEDHEPGGQVWTFSFAPVACEGIRIIGTAGGEHFFTSISELRIKGTEATAEPEAPTYTYPASGESGNILKGTVIGNETGWGGNADRGASAVFDGNPETFFDPPEKGGDNYTGMQFDSPKILEKVCVLSRGFDADWNERFDGATIDGSNDGVTWVPLWQSETVGTYPEYYVITDFNADNTGYTMFRYHNEKNHGDIAELEFYGVDAPAAAETVEETPAPAEETVEETVTVPETTTTTPTTTTTTTAPQTFDIGIIAAVAAVISLAGFAISKKK